MLKTIHQLNKQKKRTDQMNVTTASNAGELHCYDPRFDPCSILFFHFFRDVFILHLYSISAEWRRASQCGRPVWHFANKNPRLVTTINLLLSLEKAKSCSPEAPEHRWADTDLLVCHLDAPADGGLSAASHVHGKHHFILGEHW